MTSADVVKVAVQAAHVDGVKKGVSKVAGVSVFGILLVFVAAVGAIAFLNHKSSTDKQNAVYHAEFKAFSHGVDVAREEFTKANVQASKAMIV